MLAVGTCSAAVQHEHCSFLQPHKDKIMLVLGWLTVLLGVFTVLWADGAFANRGPRPDAPLAIR
jgi:hypothetical protein